MSSTIHSFKYVIALLLCSLFLQSCDRASTPASEFITIEKGLPLNFDELKENWLVINYWATWCAPCREEIPELNELDASNPDIKVIGVNYDKLKLEALIRDAKELDIQFPVLVEDPRIILNYDKPEVLPTTFIFAPQLKLHTVLKGPQTEKDILNAISASPTVTK